MQLEDYFNFLSPDDIRIKGHRIGIDNVLGYYLEGYTPEEIAAVYPDLNLEKIYATITYYYYNRQEIDAYLVRLQQWREQRYQEWLSDSPPVVQRLKAIKAKKIKLKSWLNEDSLFVRRKLIPSPKNCGSSP